MQYVVVSIFLSYKLNANCPKLALKGKYHRRSNKVDVCRSVCILKDVFLKWPQFEIAL